MNYLRIENLSKSYGEKLLFENISFTIAQGQKVAMVARNGSGKTSLMNIITKKDIADAGVVEIHKDTRVGYLPQQPEFNPDHTVLESIFSSENDLIQVLKEYNHLLAEIEKGNSQAGDLLQVQIEKIDALNAWNLESDIKEILGKFKIHDFEQKAGTLSGGQKKRIALAKVLIEDVDLLILDEPTNHLDIDMIEWLEEYLVKQKLSLFVVTHDRYFLDKVCNEIIELENQQIYHHRGNYSTYLEKKEERVQSEASSVEKAKNLYKKELEWMRRQPSARATKAKARIDSFYKLEKKTKVNTEEGMNDLQVSMQRMGKKILEIEHLNKAFDDKILVKDFSYIFKKRDRIGILGENGSGKSTLLNMITGKLKPDQGNIITGDTIVYGYYTQTGLEAPTDKRVVDIVKDVAESIMVGKTSMGASQFLTYFGFDHNTQYNHFGNLSGGEKRRLHLLLTLMANPNFLILDEPTNDLDLETLSTLEDFLDKFEGCLLIVSHDRYFMDRLTEHIFAFEGQGNIKYYPGNYSDYLQKRRDLEKQTKQKERVEKVVEQSQKKVNLSEKPKKASFKEKREYESLIIDIEVLEKEKTELLEQMNTEADPGKLQEIAIRFGEIEKLLEIKEERWLELEELM
ncbi:MAG: ATP-binding cassette domain-containing protein [Bacteroidales bacterium]|nr:ATP-binding cassette domain-containing protein [Bacteroidales bacterium]